MTSDPGFEAYRQQLFLITEWMSASRAASSFEDRATKLKAACEEAILSLDEDLHAISELEDRFTDLDVHAMPRTTDIRKPTSNCGISFSARPPSAAIGSSRAPCRDCRPLLEWQQLDRCRELPVQKT